MKTLVLSLTTTLFTTFCVAAQTQKQVILPAGTNTSYKIKVDGYVTVEAWGAGGGGNMFGGGQGGGYFKCSLVLVKAGDNLTVSVGSGGKGGISTSAGQDGENTTLSVDRPISAPPYSNGIYRFLAQGGTGSGNGIPKGGYNNGIMGYGFNLPMQYNFNGLTGGNGTPTTVPMMSVRTEINAIGTSVGGNGGDGANAPNTKGIGGSETQLLKLNTGIFYYTVSGPAFSNFNKVTAPSPGLVPGGGGGGATAFSQTTTGGADGGGGLIIITYVE